MKKLLFVLISLLIVLSFSLIKAENLTEEDIAKDMKEVEIMHTPFGATVRLLQLEKNILRNILHGEYILNAINKSNITINESEKNRLNEILVELKEINEKIAEEIKNINQTSSEDAVNHFVEWKSQAINLTKEFKKIILNELRPDKRKEIKEYLKRNQFKEVEKIQNEVIKAIKEFNKKRFERILNLTSQEKEDLINQIKEGNLTASELKKLIYENFKKINKSEKKAFLDRLKEEREKIELMKQEALNNRLRLEKNNMEKVRQILSNDNLTISEKKTRLRIMAQEKIREKIKGVNNNED